MPGEHAGQEQQPQGGATEGGRTLEMSAISESSADSSLKWAAMSPSRALRVRPNWAPRPGGLESGLSPFEDPLEADESDEEGRSAKGPPSGRVTTARRS